MRNITLIIILLFIIHITATAIDASEQKKIDRVEIKPADALEKCLKMNPD